MTSQPGDLDAIQGDGQLHYPVFGTTEDLVIGLFRPYFARLRDAGGPDVRVYTNYEEGMVMPCVLALNTRRTGIDAYAVKDEFYVRSTVLEVNTLASGRNAEKDAADLQEAIRHVFMDAHRRQVVIPNVGSLSSVSSSVMATRQTDWASSSGPTQYAKLPHSATRYEARYRILIRPPATYDNQFLTPFNGENY